LNTGLYTICPGFKHTWWHFIRLLLTKWLFTVRYSTAFEHYPQLAITTVNLIINIKIQANTGQRVNIIIKFTRQDNDDGGAEIASTLCWNIVEPFCSIFKFCSDLLIRTFIFPRFNIVQYVLFGWNRFVQLRLIL